MAIVTPEPAAEVELTRQDAMRVGIELDKLNPPPASIWFHGGPQIRVFISSISNSDARTHFDGWLDILGIEEFTEADDNSELKLTAEGTYQDIQVTISVTIYNHLAAARTKTRKVTR